MVWDNATASLVERIYDATDPEEGWMPMLELLSEQYNALGVHLFLRDIARNEALEDSYYGSQNRALMAEYQRLLPGDPLWEVSRSSPGEIIVDTDHYTESYFRKTDVYNSVLYTIECQYRAVFSQPISPELIAGFAIIRTQSMKHFDKDQIHRLRLLIPHISRSLRLQQRLRNLESEAENLVAALDRLPTAAVILSNSLQIICVNQQADALLKSSKSLRVRHGKLVPSNASDANALKKAVSEALALADGGLNAPLHPPQMVAIRREARLPLDLLAVALRPRYKIRQHLSHQARVLLMIYDPESLPYIDPQLIERLFDLTSTEADIAARLAAGKSIAEIAQERRCSAATVRTHIKHIFQKTQTNRQGQLVQLLLTSPAVSFTQ